MKARGADVPIPTDVVTATAFSADAPATVKAAEEMHEALKQAGESVALYHGRLPARERKQNQDLFMNGECRVMVATNAFGMGIDKSDTRFVIHLQVPANLEAYYQKYFNNRQEVLELAENYETEFTSRINAYEDYERRLDSLKAQIDAATKELESQREQIVADRRRLDGLRSSGRIEEYNSGVASFNGRVDAYNASVRRIQRDINTFNTLLEEQKSIAQELRSLNQSIDSRNLPELVQ